MEEESGLVKLFGVLSKLAAVVVLVALSFNTICQLGWLNALGEEMLAQISTYVVYVISYGAMTLASLVVLEFGFKKGLLVAVIMLALVALVVLPMFFSDLWATIAGYISVA